MASTASESDDVTPQAAAVEDKYLAAGPWAVSTGSASAPGTPGVVYHYPTNLGADGYQHPVITWGNGTTQQCANNSVTLNHFASWGYVVVCAESPNTGNGTEIWAATQWMLQQDTTAGSIFAGQLDTSRVGGVGASQGAEGVIRATILSNGVIDSTVPMLLPDMRWFNPPITEPPPLDEIPTPKFLVYGQNDFLTLTDPPLYFDVSAGPTTTADVVGASHGPGMERSLGYIAAWFDYTLLGDQFARSAFAGASPEISTNSGWTDWEAKNMP